MSLAELDLNQVNWLFLTSILIAKSIVFFSVIVITLLVGRHKKLATAGIYAIFCTQSNDFAIGYPIGKIVIFVLTNSLNNFFDVNNFKF